MTEEAHAERLRIKSILKLDEGRGREAAALAMALDTDLSVDAAKTLLASTPKAAPAAHSGRATDAPFGIVMGREVTAHQGDPGAPYTPAELAAEINKQSGASSSRK
jgi:hypothetical protein